MTSVPSTYAESTDSEEMTNGDDDDLYVPEDNSSSSDGLTDDEESTHQSGPSLDSDHVRFTDAGVDVEADNIPVIDVVVDVQAVVDVQPDIIPLTDVGANIEIRAKSGRKLTRKKKRDPEHWKRNVTQRLRQSGKSYTSSRGKTFPEKVVRGKCSCKMKCSSNISEDGQHEQFLAFYNLSSDEKRMFISRTTDRLPTKRKTKTENDLRRKTSFQFYFEQRKGERTRVCKKFYLATLAISQKQIYTVHASKDQSTGMPTRSKSGKVPETMCCKER